MQTVLALVSIPLLIASVLVACTSDSPTATPTRIPTPTATPKPIVRYAPSPTPVKPTATATPRVTPTPRESVRQWRIAVTATAQAKVVRKDKEREQQHERNLGLRTPVPTPPATPTATPEPTATPTPSTYAESDCEANRWGKGERRARCLELYRAEYFASIVEDGGGVLTDFKPLSAENMDIANAIWMGSTDAPTYGITGGKFQDAGRSFMKGYVDHQVAVFMSECLGGDGTDSPLEHTNMRKELEKRLELTSVWNRLEFIKDRSQPDYNIFNMDGFSMRVNLMYRVSESMYMQIGFDTSFSCGIPRSLGVVKEFTWDDIPHDAPGGSEEVDRSEILEPLTDEEMETLKLKCRLWCIESPE